MSLPLNIDFQQVLLHLLNFAILAVGLYLLLYKPVKNFMDKRSEHYKQMDADAEEKLRKAASLEESYENRLSAADAEIAQKKAVAAQEAERSAAARLEKAQAQADKLLSDARSDAEAEREKIVASAQEDIAELAAQAVEKLLQKSLDNSYDEFLSAAEGGEARGEQG